MSTIAQAVIDKNLSFSEMKRQFVSSIEEVDGAELSHGAGHVDVIFSDDSNVIYNNELPSTVFNN